MLTEFRKLVSELLIELAFRVLPRGSTEEFELAQFLVHSWIGAAVRKKKVF